MNLYIEADGTVSFVHDDELASLFKGEASTTTRASHVEPFGQGWTADMAPVGGPVLGPFETRREALEAEAAWLEAKMTEGTL